MSRSSVHTVRGAALGRKLVKRTAEIVKSIVSRVTGKRRGEVIDLYGNDCFYEGMGYL